MVREVAAGTLIAGSAGGGGYALYYFSQPKNIGEKLFTESSNGIGVPIIYMADLDNWWNKAYHRYFLELTSSEKSTLGLENLKYWEDSEKGEAGELENFKTECKKLFEKPLGEDIESDKTKAKKWCTTYKTLKEAMSLKEFDTSDGKKSDWEGKYPSTNGDSDPYRNILEKLKSNNSTSGATEQEKKAKALQTWCNWAKDASSEATKVKEKLNESNGYCVFRTA